MNEKQLVLQRLNDDNEAQNYSSEVIEYIMEKSQEFDFAYVHANMIPDEFRDYRERTIAEVVDFFQGLGR